MKELVAPIKPPMIPAQHLIADARARERDFVRANAAAFVHTARTSVGSLDRLRQQLRSVPGGGDHALILPPFPSRSDVAEHRRRLIAKKEIQPLQELQDNDLLWARCSIIDGTVCWSGYYFAEQLLLF
jgi:hypothetical protein